MSQFEVPEVSKDCICVEEDRACSQFVLVLSFLRLQEVGGVCRWSNFDWCLSLRRSVGGSVLVVLLWAAVKALWGRYQYLED